VQFVRSYLRLDVFSAASSSIFGFLAEFSFTCLSDPSFAMVRDPPFAIYAAAPFVRAGLCLPDDLVELSFPVRASDGGED